MRAILHAIGDGEVEAGVPEDLLAHFDVGALHANNDGNFDVKIFGGGDKPVQPQQAQAANGQDPNNPDPKNQDPKKKKGLFGKIAGIFKDDKAAPPVSKPADGQTAPH